jgi:CheY-like chemotaxis protein
VPVIIVSVVAEAATVAGFPVHDALPKPLDAERLRASLRRAGVLPEREGRILVVDDDAGARNLMSATLAQLGYRTVAVADGETALAEAAAACPLAVVLDLIMPHMDGFAFLHRFRQDPEHRNVPVIIWSLKELTREEESLLRSSAQGVVRKDGPGAELFVETLRAVCPGAGRIVG